MHKGCSSASVPTPPCLSQGFRELRLGDSQVWGGGGRGVGQGGNTIRIDSTSSRFGGIGQILNILPHFVHIFRLGVFNVSL